MLYALCVCVSDEKWVFACTVSMCVYLLIIYVLMLTVWAIMYTWYSFSGAAACPAVSALGEQFFSLRWIKTLLVDAFSYWRRMWTQHSLAKTRCPVSQRFWLTVDIIKIPRFLEVLGHQCNITASLLSCALFCNQADVGTALLSN